MLDQPGYTFIPFAAKTDRPVHGGVYSDLGFPLRTDLREIVHPHVRCSAAIRPVDNNDILVGQIHSRVCLLEFRVAPLRDLAQKNSGERFRCEVDFLSDAGHIVSRNDGAQDGRKMKDLRLRLLKLFVGHWTVGRSEIDGALDDLANSPTRANRLIVDLNLRKLAMIFVEPLRINRVRESCACPIDKDLIRGRRCRLRPLTAGAANTEKRESQYQNNSFHTLPPLVN